MWSNAQSNGGPLMRSANTVLATLIIVSLWVQGQRIRAQTTEQHKRIVIAASTVLYGKGRVLRDTRIVIEGSKIVAIDPKASPVDYDLRGLTLMPGWIDAHVHITWSFGKDGKNAGPGETTQDAAYRAAANAWITLMAGFTTVQSVGSPNDVPLRDAIAKGSLPGRDNAGRRVSSCRECLDHADGRLHNRAKRRLAQRRSAARCDRKRLAAWQRQRRTPRIELPRMLGSR